MEVLKVLAVSLALSFLTESLVEYLLGQVVDHFERLEGWRWALIYWAAMVGVGLAFFYKLDLVVLIDITGGKPPRTAAVDHESR